MELYYIDTVNLGFAYLLLSNLVLCHTRYIFKLRDAQYRVHCVVLLTVYCFTTIFALYHGHFLYSVRVSPTTTTTTTTTTTMKDQLVFCGFLVYHIGLSVVIFIVHTSRKKKITLRKTCHYVSDKYNISFRYLVTLCRNIGYTHFPVEHMETTLDTLERKFNELHRENHGDDDDDDDVVDDDDDKKWLKKELMYCANEVDRRAKMAIRYVSELEKEEERRREAAENYQKTLTMIRYLPTRIDLHATIEKTIQHATTSSSQMMTAMTFDRYLDTRNF